jgi:hypothetical protein
MKEIRVTAHFGTRQEVLDACKSLLKKCPNDYNEIRSIGKKVSFINTMHSMPKSITVGRTRLLLEESSANVLHHLSDCKGLIYSMVVNN